ncbi:MAG: metallophosphoesterase family protein [Halioglobus sp.]|nr:metallophosphoesterase family protein [Halioglobus sp.]
MIKPIIPVMTAIGLVLAGCSNSNNNNDDNNAVATCSGEAVQAVRLFLQQLSSDSVIIKWRGNADGDTEASSVCFGTDMAALPADSETAATVTATGHSEVLLSGLEPDTTYYYSVGGAGVADEAHHFRTAPVTGELPADGNTRIWIVGDSGVGGTGKPESGYVRDGFLAFAQNQGDEPADLFLMLGDNAYDQGTDMEHQKGIFDVYTSVLASTPVWPTIGNHEMGTVGLSTSSNPESYTVLGDGSNGGPDPAPDSPMPYLNIFSLPTDGEAGGLASGTEQYYSFDYANVHVVSLDSQLAIRDTDSRAAMMQWLKDDLMANTQDWTIVIYHHPPYTKGSHDSDSTLNGIDDPIFTIREEFTPIFEQYGVDLAYAGHSHIYERSYYINGNTGLSDTFDAATMAELNDMNMPASGQGDEAYTQIARNGMDDKVVYTVAGNGGKITYTTPGYPHPANFFSQLELGSVVIDLDENQLEASFVDVNGTVLDSFIITR